MARPVKEGLDYFPLDVGIFEDEKIEAIAGEFGPKGELAVIKLLCAIYKKGYFILWNDLTQATLLKRLPGASKEMINQIVNRLVSWGFFDETLFDSVRVLTSENIQATYFEATKRRKTPKPTKYIINVNNNSQNNEVNVDINTQSKVNKTKEKESKVNKNKSNNTDVLLEHFLQIFTDFTKGVKSQPRSQASAAFVDLGTEERRQQAITGAKNYVEWYKSTGERIKYSINAAKFLEDMVFMDYQEMPEVKEKRDTYRKAGKSIPEWSTPYQEPEYSEEEIADVFKD